MGVVPMEIRRVLGLPSWGNKTTVSCQAWSSARAVHGLLCWVISPASSLINESLYNFLRTKLTVNTTPTIFTRQRILKVTRL